MAAAAAIAMSSRVLAGCGEKSMISGSERSGSGTAHAPRLKAHHATLVAAEAR
jgi:hypothetical protein